MPKGRDSGMPAIEQWESYFDPPRLFDALDVGRMDGDAIEFGCGYGTFTLEAARRVRGTLLALDIERSMVETTATRVARAGLSNVVVEQRDFVLRGCGRPPGSTSLAMLFNILHIEDPVGLLRDAHAALRTRGQAAIIHWIHDGRTPRGPPLGIRPRPEECRAWGEAAGLSWLRDQALPGSPWHWGMVMEKPAQPWNQPVPLICAAT